MEKLSERKKKILRAVVEGYIETANPISSKGIQESVLHDCSSATIRNELSTLESMGYLIQPHVSAGRIPSQQAFRLYVDELMLQESLNEEEVSLITQFFSQKVDSLEEVVVNVAKILSEITHYPSIVVKEDNIDIITTIKLVDLNNGKALVVIVTDCQVLKDSFIDLPENFTTSILKSAENWLNKIFVGKHISDFINYKFPLELVNEEIDNFNVIFKRIVDVLKKASFKANMQVITDGSNKILEHVEYQDMQKAKDFLDRVEQKEVLADLLYSDEDLSVKIDKEDSAPEGCSVVHAKVNLGENISGNIGVIGPVRMNYKRSRIVAMSFL